MKNTHIGRRILAALVDYTFIYAFFAVYIYAFGQPSEEGRYEVNGLPALVPLVFWLMMTSGVEQLVGCTIGNFLAGLRPVSLIEGSKQLTFSQSLKRHLLDPVDMFFFGFVAVITIRNTPNRQRIGDIWAHTKVERQES